MSDYLPELPDELVVETILLRLPVKSILRCRCVCRSWYYLLKTRNFISNHFLHSKTLTSKNPQKVVAQWHNHNQIKKLLYHFDKDDYFQSIPFPFPPRFSYDKKLTLIGSSNGLICFSMCNDKFIMFNPSIGRFHSIFPPSSRRCWVVIGFGFDESTQDYNILLIMPDVDYFIYSLNLNVWRRIITPPTPESWSINPLNSVLFVNGRFHWLACRSFLDTVFIRVFDVKTETFGQISLPECLSKTKAIAFHFTEFGDSSVAVIEQDTMLTGRQKAVNHHIWVMKEYGSVESWFKLATIRLVGLDECVLGFRNENEVFIKRFTGDYRGRISLQKINNAKQVTALMHSDDIHLFHFSVHTYVPTLFLLDKGNQFHVAAPTNTIVDIALPTPFRKRKQISNPVDHGIPNCKKKQKN